MNYELCTYSVYELSSKKSKDGRRNIKLILHEIFPDNTKWQKNGISWNEQYTQNNIDSVCGMSLCAEFMDESRTQPYGHGLTGTRDNMPIFEDATMIGVFHKGYISTVNVDGVEKKVLMAEGHIDELRYPNFVKWLEDQMKNGVVKGSVEIIGTEENDNKIVYDGGWKEIGRVPMEYRYSGHVILGIKPADDSAVIIELNNNIDQFKEEKQEMDEKTLNQFISDIKSTVSATITEVNADKKTYEDKITELNSSVSEKDTKISELNEKVAQIQKDIEGKDAAIAAKDAKINTLTEENAKLSNAQKINELNAALADFTDAQKDYAKGEIEAFKADPSKYEVNAVVSKICTEIVKNAKNKNVNHEQNSEDIFGYMGSAEDNDNDDTSDIF